MAALVVAPMYLYELHRTGITPAAFLGRLAPAALGAAVVAVVAVLAAHAIPLHILAVLVAGLAALGALALLLYRMRGTISALRSVGDPPVAVAEPVVAV